MKKTVVFLPCYKRIEYTELCIKSILEGQVYDDSVHFYLVDDGSNDGTFDLFADFLEIVSDEQLTVVRHSEPMGLRNTIIEFFDWVRERNDFVYMTKIDNDCTVPKNWLNDLIKILEDADADIISPNVSETNAATKYGSNKDRIGDFIPSKFVGGVWTMKADLINDIYFERIGKSGIKGAFHLLNQIILHNDPKVGWTDAVTYQDIGYWAGTHPHHIKSPEHAEYSAEIGRPIAWSPTKDKTE